MLLLFNYLNFWDVNLTIYFLQKLLSSPKDKNNFLFYRMITPLTQLKKEKKKKTSY